MTLSHVEFASGFRNNLDTIGALCRERGIYFFVDAIQGLGVLPLDVRQTPIDFLAADGHKWLLGPEGAAIFYLRRELIDLARHHFGRKGWAANLDSNALATESSVAVLGICREPVAPADPPPEELEVWAAFHMAVGRLPAEEREVFNLRYYHGWKECDIAELLQIDDRTVRRKWRHACLQLNALLRQ